MAKQTFTTGQVLTAAQMTSLQQTAMLGGAASAKTASYTLVAADAGGAISMSNASATTITVNTALFAAGDTVQITNLGAGVCTITAGTATVNTSASLALAQYESGTLDFTSTSAAIFIKGAGAAASSGGMTLLSTTTMSGTTTTVSSINQTYKDLAIRVTGVKWSGADTIVKFNYNGSVNISGTSISGDSGSIATGGFSRAEPNCWYTAVGGTIGNNEIAIYMYDYANTTTKKAFTMLGVADYVSAWTTGVIDRTDAILQIMISNQAGNTFTAGTIKIYGVN